MSPEIRMYFPLTPAQVARLHADRRLDAGLVGFDVDESIRNGEADGDSELWEFAALQRAAAHARNTGGPVVIAAVDVTSSTDLTMLRDERTGTLNHPLVIENVACLHLGDDALDAGALDDGAFEESAGPEAGQHIDLSWFDISEMAQVVRLLSPPQ